MSLLGRGLHGHGAAAGVHRHGGVPPTTTTTTTTTTTAAAAAATTTTNHHHDNVMMIIIVMIIMIIVVTKMISLPSYSQARGQLDLRHALAAPTEPSPRGPHQPHPGRMLSILQYSIV